MAEEKKDKAENELDLVSDCEWMRGLDASGKPIRISKSDMVELIRANMPVATGEKSGLMSDYDRGCLRYFNFFNIVGNINVGIVNGLIRFRIWSQTDEMSLYFVSSRTNVVHFITGRDISELGHSFSFNSSSELILEDKIGNGRINHILGLSENIV